MEVVAYDGCLLGVVADVCALVYAFGRLADCESDLDRVGEEGAGEVAYLFGHGG